MPNDSFNNYNQNKYYDDDYDDYLNKYNTPGTNKDRGILREDEKSKIRKDYREELERRYENE